MQGPITVFDGGTYAGDARIEDLQPNEERLISYAMDLKSEVEPLQQSGANEITSIQIRKGVIAIKHRLLQSKVYTIRNKSSEKRTLLVEHPFRSDWKLIEPPKPVERTPTVYRFRTVVEGGKSEKLTVNEEQITSESVGLFNADLNMLSVYSRHGAVTAKTKEALEKVISMRTALSELERRGSDLDRQINEISQEQSRIRENMKVLPQNSELYTRYLKKFDDQETQIERLRADLTKVRDEQAAQRKRLQEYINSIQID